MVSPQEEPALRNVLLERNMAVLIREMDVECDDRGRPLLAGLFGVPHRNGLHMFFDRRPQNCDESIGPISQWVHSLAACCHDLAGALGAQAKT